jgi:hypothetical protein
MRAAHQPERYQQHQRSMGQLGGHSNIIVPHRRGDEGARLGSITENGNVCEVDGFHFMNRRQWLSLISWIYYTLRTAPVQP